MLWKLTCGALLFILIVLILIINNGHREDEDLEPDTSIQLDVVRVEGRKKIKQHVPKFMLDLYHQNANGSAFRGPDIVRSVIPKSAGSVTESQKTFVEYKHVLVFDIPTENEDEEFLSAELKLLTILKQSELNDLEKSIKISIFDNTNNNSARIVDEHHIPRAQTSWLSFNLTVPVRILKQSNTSNHLKVLISMRSYLPNSLKLSLMPENESIEHDYPILLLSYRSIKRLTRTKRATVNLEDDYDEDEDERRLAKAARKARNGCKRRPLYVDFAEIDYDAWIVQPSGYEAFQCQGKCFFPVAEHLTPTKHAIVQALVHSISPSRATRSCCVPTKLEPISLLYIDARGILTYRYAYKEMTVAECGCR